MQGKHATWRARESLFMDDMMKKGKVFCLANRLWNVQNFHFSGSTSFLFFILSSSSLLKFFNGKRFLFYRSWRRTKWILQWATVEDFYRKKSIIKFLASSPSSSFIHSGRRAFTFFRKLHVQEILLNLIGCEVTQLLAVISIRHLGRAVGHPARVKSEIWVVGRKSRKKRRRF